MPQQDIPLEASEELAFTPASLAKIEGAPVFYFRTATHREKKFHRRLLREEGIEYHPADVVREEMLKGLEMLWTPEHNAQYTPILKEYWQALDDYALQLKDDPKLVWEFDLAVQDACDNLVRGISQQWKPVGRMLADNAEVQDMGVNLYGLVMIKAWKGLDVTRDLDRGYITYDCLEALKAALQKFEKANPREGFEPGLAWKEVLLAANACMTLSREEAKNFVSPSPSKDPQSPSNESSEAGTSQASALSVTKPARSPRKGSKTSKPTRARSSATTTGNSSGSTASATAE